MRQSSPPSYEPEPPSANGHIISTQTWRMNCLRSQAWADEQRLAALKRTTRRRWMTLVFTCVLIAAVVVVLVEVVG